MWQSTSTQAAMFSSMWVNIPTSTTVTRSPATAARRRRQRRVLIHVDTEKSAQLVNSRLAYVSVSRGQYDAQIYNDKSELARDLSHYVSQRTATEVQRTGPRSGFCAPRSAPRRANAGPCIGNWSWVICTHLNDSSIAALEPRHSAIRLSSYPNLAELLSGDRLPG